MRYCIILLLLLLLKFNLHAQCDYVRNEHDRFLKVNIKETSTMLFLNLFERFNINFLSIGDTMAVKITHASAGAKAIVVSQNEPIMFLLEDDSLVTLYPTQISAGDISSPGGINMTTITVLYGLSVEIAEKLAAVSIKAFRMYEVDSYKEHDVKNKNALKIKQALICVGGGYKKK